MDDVLRALADATRRKIIALVWSRERLAGDIAGHFEMSRPAVSQHLKVLLEAGLIFVRADGTRRYYRANPESVAAVRVMLDSYWDDRLALLKAAAEAEHREGDGTMTDTATMNGTLRREVYIEAPQATVFAFFTDPDKMARWMGVSHELDPRPGGVFTVDVTNGDIAKGEYREVLPNSRIVFSWGWKNPEAAVPPGSSEVAIDLQPKNSGTMLTLTHSGLPESAIAPHNHGWEHFCERLAIAAAGRDPGPDPWVKPDTAQQAG